MTSEEIRSITPGPEMDAAVALALGTTGIRTITVIDGTGIHNRPGTLGPQYRMSDGRMGREAKQLPHYSTDIAYAREVETEIERRGLAREYVERLMGEIAEDYPRNGWANWWALIRATPEQRCRAALLALAAAGK